MNELSNEDRVLLAEFVGCKRQMAPSCRPIDQTLPWDHEPVRQEVQWFDRHGNLIKEPPNPITSHADCHALLDELERRGWYWYMGAERNETTGKMERYEQLDHIDAAPETQYEDDYRIGFVTLALPIVRQWAQERESSQNWAETLSGTPHGP